MQGEVEMEEEKENERRSELQKYSQEQLIDMVIALEKKVKEFQMMFEFLPPTVQYFTRNMSRYFVFTNRARQHVVGKLVRVDYKPDTYWIITIRRLYLPEYGGWKYVYAVTSIPASDVIDVNLIEDMKTPEEYEGEREEEVVAQEA